jgi:hypothetical protein
MARLQTPTAVEVPGPWLIEISHLLALDDIYASYIPRLEENQEVAIHEEIERRIKQHTPENASQDLARQIAERLAKGVRETRGFVGRERRITVYLPGGRTLQTELFSEVINHATTTNEVPLGFRSSLTVEPVRIVVELRGSDLDMDVTPNIDPLSQEVYGALLNWVSDVQAPVWLKTWLKYKVLALMLLSFSLLVLLLVGVGWSQQTAISYFKVEAHKLLSGGVTPANQPRAVELLLAIVSDYSGSAAKGPSLRYWTTIGLLALMFPCLYFCPRVVIGVWRGKARIKRWRIWIRMMSISIPALLISTLGMPWILKWLGLLP